MSMIKSGSGLPNSRGGSGGPDSYGSDFSPAGFRLQTPVLRPEGFQGAALFPRIRWIGQAGEVEGFRRSIQGAAAPAVGRAPPL